MGDQNRVVLARLIGLYKDGHGAIELAAIEVRQRQQNLGAVKMWLKFESFAKLRDGGGIAAAHIKSEAKIGARLRRTGIKLNHLLVDLRGAIELLIADRRLPFRRQLREICGLCKDGACQ